MPNRILAKSFTSFLAISVAILFSSSSPIADAHSGVSSSSGNCRLLEELYVPAQEFAESGTGISKDLGDCLISLYVKFDEGVNGVSREGDRSTECNLVIRGASLPSEVAGFADGMSVEVAAEGDCSAYELVSTITLNAPQTTVDSSAGPLSSHSSMLGATHRDLVGQIRGHDCCELQMFRNTVNLAWWYTGTEMFGPSQSYSVSTNDFWEQGVRVRWAEWAHDDRYDAVQSVGFDSDGFPTGILPDVHASTFMQASGYSDGHATCTYSHSFDNGASYYPNLHFHVDCFNP